MGDTITLLMLKQHAKINKILKDYESQAKSIKQKELFSIFKGNLEKHFFIEENAIFFYITPKDKEQRIQINNLIKDHETMRDVCSEIVAELLLGKKPDVSTFRKILFGHERREVEIFYPRLDKELGAEEKQDIIKRINEVKL
jgi:hemerythrin superfamily protein